MCKLGGPLESCMEAWSVGQLPQSSLIGGSDKEAQLL
jgi:hypothetical protein